MQIDNQIASRHWRSRRAIPTTFRAARTPFRIGDYRAIFEMLHGTLWVIAIKRRDEARSFNRQTT